MASNVKAANSPKKEVTTNDIMRDANKRTKYTKNAFRFPSGSPATIPVASRASSSKKETYQERQIRIRQQKANTRAARANSRNRVQGIRYKRSATRKTIKK
jgi:hypothetical protein